MLESLFCIRVEMDGIVRTQVFPVKGEVNDYYAKVLAAMQAKDWVQDESRGNRFSRHGMAIELDVVIPVHVSNAEALATIVSNF